MRINYERVLTQAKEIESLGNDLKKILNELNSMMCEIPDAWSGEASRTYMKACNELKNKISDSSQRVISAARDIRITANKIHDEDERMARSARFIKNK